MVPIFLPTSGEVLAYAVRDYTDEAYDRVKNALERKYLPLGLAAIWECSPLLAEARKKISPPLIEIHEICHIIVTFPGSTAVNRISELLIQAQIVPDSEGQFEQANAIASELFTLTMLYTRAQNLARHMRTAVNSHLKILGIGTSGDRSRTSSLYESALRLRSDDEPLLKRINQLREANLKTEVDVDDWADEINNLLSLTSGAGIMTTKSLERAKHQQGGISPGAANSYKLRFKQALASTLGIYSSIKDVRFEKMPNKSIEGLLRELEDLPQQYVKLYQILDKARPKRVNRPDATRNEFIRGFMGMSDGSSNKNLIKHVLNLGGRQLLIEGSRGAFTQEMINGVLKTVSLQLSIDPEAKELRAAFESRGQVLRIQLEQPKKADQQKLSDILIQLI